MCQHGFFGAAGGVMLSGAADTFADQLAECGTAAGAAFIVAGVEDGVVDEVVRVGLADRVIDPGTEGEAAGGVGPVVVAAPVAVEIEVGDVVVARASTQALMKDGSKGGSNLPVACVFAPLRGLRRGGERPLVCGAALSQRRPDAAEVFALLARCRWCRQRVHKCRERPCACRRVGLGVEKPRGQLRHGARGQVEPFEKAPKRRGIEAGGVGHLYGALVGFPFFVGRKAQVVARSDQVGSHLPQLRAAVAPATAQQTVQPLPDQPAQAALGAARAGDV